MGDLNRLDWMVVKYDVLLSDDLNDFLAKLCAITQQYYWEGSVNIDSLKRFWFPSDNNGDCFKKNIDVPFTFLKINTNMIFLS